MEEIIKKIKPQLSPQTIKKYVLSIHKLYNSFNKNETDITKLKWIYNTDKIMEYIDNQKSNTTKKTYITDMITLLDYDKQFNNKNNQDEIMKYVNLQKDNQLKVNINQKLNNTKSYDKIINMNKYNELLQKLKTNGLFMEYLLFSFLIKYPIRNELSTFIYIHKKDYDKLTDTQKTDKNYIVKQTKNYAVYRYKYKTFYKYKVNRFVINDKSIIKLLNEYVKTNNIQSNNPLFIYKNRNMTENDLSQRLSYLSNKYIGIKLSTGSIIKILMNDYTTTTKDNENERKEFIKDKAKIRGTDPNTLTAYYVFNKNVNIDSNEED